ncbi:hypothetical protein P153DRAFT_4723 [Dothidotthia symphoricarpi CBS 119687]|uniref:Uncharacterized protein n=1 Tax=Dothidotthia symphoricarpi CBS 119687 TaxID=1392245 RepID=A0A6A6ATN8_9PLEO|nr:uncharacterized protein P153DRAFT_4723 [Dothidotthia symphoricarpi CBS 119687]KAF2134573.1 hypothetical protein P153DRAFT_4723 [Dothidotthia symphoricarpi CBS 119687]
MISAVVDLAVRTQLVRRKAPWSPLQERSMSWFAQPLMEQRLRELGIERVDILVLVIWIVRRDDGIVQVQDGQRQNQLGRYLIGTRARRVSISVAFFAADGCRLPTWFRWVLCRSAIHPGVSSQLVQVPRHSLLGSTMLTTADNKLCLKNGL